MFTVMESLIGLAVLCLMVGMSNQAFADGDFQPDLFVFRNGLGFAEAKKEAQDLKAMGYAGVSQVYGRDDLAARVQTYKQTGLRVLSVYLDGSSKAVTAEQLQPLASCGALVELTVRKMTPTTVQAVRETAATAAALKIGVALYPHHGFAVATMAQAQALIEKVDHPNLGVTFNLCHFLKSEPADSLERVLKQAGTRLFHVTTNGADLDGKNWQTLIQPLNKGSFPQERLLRALKEMAYDGAVGLQCYNVKGDKKQNLKRSFDAWLALLEKL